MVVPQDSRVYKSVGFCNRKERDKQNNWSKDEMGLLKMLNKYVDCSCGHPPEKEREKKHHEAGGGSEKAQQSCMRLAVSQLSLAS